MKFNYTFEMMNMGDEICAVPVGEGSENFHGMIQLNEDSAAVFTAISESSTPEEAHKKLCEQYPDEDVNELGEKLAEFMNQLIAEGILNPD